MAKINIRQQLQNDHLRSNAFSNRYDFYFYRWLIHLSPFICWRPLHPILTHKSLGSRTQIAWWVIGPEKMTCLCFYIIAYRIVIDSTGQHPGTWELACWHNGWVCFPYHVFNTPYIYMVDVYCWLTYVFPKDYFFLVTYHGGTLATKKRSCYSKGPFFQNKK